MKSFSNIKFFFKRKIPFSGRGVTIAFLGQDGAGKSTVTDDIVKWLNWKIEARKYYLGSGDHYHSWKKNLRKKILKKQNVITKWFGLYLAMSDCVSVARHVCITIKKAEKYVKNGGVAIFDRFPQIEYAGINDGPKIRENYLKKVNGGFIFYIIEHKANREEKYIRQAISYQPDIVFKLILSPKESIKRKPEENIEIVTRKHNIIQNMNFPMSEVHIINAEQSYSREIVEIKNYIWEYLTREAGK